MKYALSLSVLCMVFFSCQSLYIQNPTGDPESDLQQILDYYQSRKHRVGLGVLYFNPELGSFTAFAGPQIVDTDQFLNSDSLFEIASTSKLLMAVMIMQLVEEKKLDLLTTLDTFFPEIPRSREILIRDLMNHTSGIPDYFSHSDFLSSDAHFQKEWTSEELLALGLTAPAVEPDTWNYSNTNYILLGLIVEAVTGQTAETEIRRRILEPLGMDSTFYRVTEGVTGPVAHGYYADQQGHYWDSWTGIDPSAYSWAGAYVSTPEDMKQFLMAYQDGSLISSSSRELLEVFIPTPNNFDYGLGVLRLDLFNGKYIGHGGTSLGTRCLCLLAPNTGEILILYTTLAKDDIYLLLQSVEALVEKY